MIYQKLTAYFYLLIISRSLQKLEYSRHYSCADVIKKAARSTIFFYFLSKTCIAIVNISGNFTGNILSAIPCINMYTFADYQAEILLQLLFFKVSISIVQIKALTFG